MSAIALRLVVLSLLAASVQTPLPTRDVDRGDFSNVDEARQVVVRTTGEWTTLWRQHTPDRPQPDVDFGRDMVLGVFLGSRTSAGWSAEVASVSPTTDGLVVRYREKRPIAGGVAAQVITTPFHLVSLSKKPGQIRFEKID